MGADLSKEAKILQSVQGLYRDKTGWKGVVQEFVDLVPHGTPLKFNQKQVVEVIASLISQSLEAQDHHSGTLLLLDASLRMFAARGLFGSLNRATMTPYITALRVQDEVTLHAALLVMKSMLEFSNMEEKDPADKLETANRKLFEQERGIEELEAVLLKYGKSDSPDILLSVIDIYFTLLVSREQTTPYDTVRRILSMLLPHVTLLFDLSRHPLMPIRLRVCYILRKMMMESAVSGYKTIQKVALLHGSLLWHLYYAVLDNDDENIGLEEDYSEQKQVSRDLVGLLCDGENTYGREVLLKVLPRALFRRLRDSSGENTTAANGREHSTSISVIPRTRGDSLVLNTSAPVKKQRSMSRAQKQLLNSSVQHAGVLKGNWDAVWEDFELNYVAPDIIWNDATRMELRAKLRAEIADLDHDRQIFKQTVPWQWQGYTVKYQCLDSHCRVEPYYLHLLTEAVEGAAFSVTEPSKFMKKLYDRLTVEDEVSHQDEIIRCMKALVDRYDLFEETPIHFLTWLFRPDNLHPHLKHNLINLFKLLLTNQKNVRKFLAEDGVESLVQHLCYIHLDEDRVNSQQLARDLLHLLESVVTYPRMKKRLCTTELLTPIVQVTAYDNLEIASIACKILGDIVAAKPDLVADVYQTGVFNFIVAAMETGCTEHMSNFLRNFHSLQEWGGTKSYLEAFMPEPMVRVLDKEGAETFSRIMCSDVMQPDLIWNQSLRRHMTATVNRQLAQFKRAIRSDPGVRFVFREPDVVRFAELENELCMGTLYLRFFIANERFPVKSPSRFMRQMVELMDKDPEVTDLNYLLTAQEQLLSRFPQDPSFLEYEGYGPLFKVFFRDVTSRDSQKVIMAALGLIVSLLHAGSKPEHRQKAKKACLDAGAVEVVVLLVEKLAVEEAVSPALLFKSVQLLCLLSDENTAQQAVSQLPNLIPRILQFCGVEDVDQSPDLAQAAIECMSAFMENSQLRHQVVGAGGLLFLLRIAILDGDTAQVLLAAEEAHIRTGSKMSARRECYEAAAKALLEASHVRELGPVLEKLMTSGLKRALANPSSFIVQGRSELMTPALIWTAEMRQQLRLYLEREFHRVAQTGRWDPEQHTAIDYTAVAPPEPEVGGVFLRVLVEQNDCEIDNPPVFLKDLTQSIADDHRSLASKFDDGEFDNDDIIALDAVALKIAAVEAVLKRNPKYVDKCSQDPNFSAIAALFEFTYPPVVLSCVSLFDKMVSLSGEAAAVPYRLMGRLHQVLHSRYLGDDADNVAEPGLRLLSNLGRSQPGAPQKILDQGMMVSSLYYLSTPGAGGAVELRESIRRNAARCLGALVLDRQLGKEFEDILSVFFPSKLVDLVRTVGWDDPQSFVTFFDDDHETATMVWNSSTRADLREFLRTEMDPMVEWLNSPGNAPYEWRYHTLHERFTPAAMDSEVKVGDVFVRNFNANPDSDAVDASKLFRQLLDVADTEDKEYRLMREDPEHDAEKLRLQGKRGEAIWEALYHILSRNPFYFEKMEWVDRVSLLYSQLEPGMDEHTQVQALRILPLMAQRQLDLEVLEQNGFAPRVFSLLRPLSRRLSSILPVLNDLVAKSDKMIRQVVQSGRILFLAEVLLGHTEHVFKQEAATVLLTMARNTKVGSRIIEYTEDLFTQRFGTALDGTPAKFLEFFDDDHSIAGRTWDATSREKLLMFIEHELDSLMKKGEWDGSTEMWDVKKAAQVYRR